MDGLMKLEIPGGKLCLLRLDAVDDAQLARWETWLDPEKRARIGRQDAQHRRQQSPKVSVGEPGSQEHRQHKDGNGKAGAWLHALEQNTESHSHKKDQQRDLQISEGKGEQLEKTGTFGMRIGHRDLLAIFSIADGALICRKKSGEKRGRKQFWQRCVWIHTRLRENGRGVE